MKIKKLLTAGILGMVLTMFPTANSMAAETSPTTSTTPTAPVEAGEAETAPAAPVEDGPSEEEIRDAIMSHQTKRDDGIELFDPESAERDNVDPRIIEVGKIYNGMVLEQKALTDPGMVQEIVPLEDYGNWCGPKNSGPGEPINSLDRACMGHDHCLNLGRDSCTCDQEFIDKLRSLRGEYPWETHGYARTYLEAAIITVPPYHGCFLM
ncbi:MAG: hypothetical protein Q4A92_07825 [Corynebacterium sp.]|nr:hypothetical protein [Corynebacterium sp.]